MGLADALKAKEIAVVAEVVKDIEKVAEVVVNALPEKTKAPLKELVEDAKEGFEASAKKLEALRNNRNESDIPLNDEYWQYRNAHQLAHSFNTFVEKVEEKK